ncbi:MAG TPA: hypothetical protein VF109_01235 [Mycobacteriales bacterium]
MPEHAKGRRAPPEHAAPRHPHRRPAAVAAATVLVLAAAGTVIARTGDRPAPAPPRTTTPSQPAGSVAAGAPCDWQREGDAEIGAGGQALRCVLTGDGYRWTAG